MAGSFQKDPEFQVENKFHMELWKGQKMKIVVIGPHTTDNYQGKDLCVDDLDPFDCTVGYLT